MHSNNNLHLLVQVIVQEFMALRNEIITTMNSQYRITSIGTVIVPSLLGGAFAAWELSSLISASILLAASAMCIAILVNWCIGETRRIRASLYVKHFLEPKMNILLPFTGEQEKKLGDLSDIKGKPWAWEEFLRDVDVLEYYKERHGGLAFEKHYRFLERGILSIFCPLFIASVALSLSLSWFNPVIFAVSLAQIVFMIRYSHHIRKLTQAEEALGENIDSKGHKPQTATETK
ncbi:hypothetical protein ACFLVY_01640 [Chloroflexota bacterium]